MILLKGFDLIFFRNVTIYFTEEAKRELYTNIFRWLIEGGVLSIGSTEVMLEVAKLGFLKIRVSLYQKPEKPRKNRLTILEKTAVKM